VVRRLAVLLALLALPASAHAAAPDPVKLERSGLKVTWPVVGASDVLEAGYTFTVRVKRKTPGPAARLALIQLAPRKVLARRKLRDGRFRATIPEAHEARYRLVLKVGKRRWWSVIRTPPAPAPLPPVPAPGEPLYAAYCASEMGTRAATVTLEHPTARMGDIVRYELRNTGTACFHFGQGLTWERQAGDSWQAVTCQVRGLECAYTMELLTLPPGQAYAAQALIHDNMTPGHYRLAKPYGDDGQRAYAELDVVGG
jgi:hypothetical protein